MVAVGQKISILWDVAPDWLPVLQEVTLSSCTCWQNYVNSVDLKGIRDVRGKSGGWRIGGLGEWGWI